MLCLKDIPTTSKRSLVALRVCLLPRSIVLGWHPTPMARLWWQPLSCERIFVDFEFWLRLNSALYIFQVISNTFFIFFPCIQHWPHCGNGIADADTMAGVQRCQLPQGTLMLSSHSSLAVLVLGWDRTTKITKSCKNHRWKVKRLKRW